MGLRCNYLHEAGGYLVGQSRHSICTIGSGPRHALAVVISGMTNSATNNIMRFTFRDMVPPQIKIPLLRGGLGCSIGSEWKVSGVAITPPLT
jgi:hypothetical protein